MKREKKLELLRRILGLRHKLRVHDSMKPGETHEDVAIMTVSKWEFEDEIKALEEILAQARTKNVEFKKGLIVKDYDLDSPENAEPDPVAPGAMKKASKK